jgi:hypothetical protein
LENVHSIAHKFLLRTARVAGQTAQIAIFPGSDDYNIPFPVGDTKKTTMMMMMMIMTTTTTTTYRGVEAERDDHEEEDDGPERGSANGAHGFRVHHEDQAYVCNTSSTRHVTSYNNTHHIVLEF